MKPPHKFSPLTPLRPRSADPTSTWVWYDPSSVATVLVTKFCILLFGYQSFQIVNGEPSKSFYRFFEIWNRWDSNHYLTIAQFGYTAVGEQRFLIVYFPFLPLLTKLFELLTGDYLISAFLVSFVASLALGLTFWYLIRLDYSEKIARNAVLFLFIFPTAFFLHIGYTESLFLALVVGTFLAARKRNWMLVGILGAFACLTRINGLVLLPALAFEIWNEYYETRKINYHWLWLALVGAGFGVYLAINYFVTGDPTMFLVHQREHWFKQLSLPIWGLWELTKTALYDKPEPSQMRGFQELFFAFIGLASIIIGWKTLRASYRTWLVLNWLLFVSTSFVISVPRYTISLFPIFLVMSIYSVKSWTINLILLVWSLLFLGFFSMRFAAGFWAF